MFDDEKNVFKPEDFEEDEEFFFSSDADDDEKLYTSEEQENSDVVFEDFENENLGDGGTDSSDDTADDDNDGENDKDEGGEDSDSNSEDEEDNQQVGREIGIDLGTTNSVIAYIDKNGASKFVKVKNESLIPSFIFFKDKETVYYGKKAKSYAKAMSQGASVSLFKKHLRADSEKIKVRIPKDENVGKDGKKYFSPSCEIEKFYINDYPPYNCIDQCPEDYIVWN